MKGLSKGVSSPVFVKGKIIGTRVVPARTVTTKAVVKAEPKSLADIIRDAPRIAAPVSLTSQTPTPTISRAEVEACKPSQNHGDLIGAVIAIGKKYREGVK